MRMVQMLAVLALFQAAGSLAIAQAFPEVVREAVDAHGGLDRLRKFATCRAKAVGVVFDDDGKATAFESDSWYHASGYSRIDARMEPGGPFRRQTRVVSPEGIRFVTDGVSERLEGEQLVVARQLERLGGLKVLYPLVDDRSYHLTDTEELSDKGRRLKGVRAKREQQPDVMVYFDAQTKLLARIMFGTKPAKDGGVWVADVYDEYEEVGGAKYAKRCRRFINSRQLDEARIKSIEPLDRLSLDIFK